MADAESFDSAFGAVSEEAVAGGADDMEPVGFSAATHSGFVRMEDGGLDQNIADFIHG